MEAREFAREESNLNVIFLPGKPRETFRVGKAFRLSGGLSTGQSMIKDLARVNV